MKGKFNHVVVKPLEGNFFERKYINLGNTKLYIPPVDNWYENTEHIYEAASSCEHDKKGYDIQKGDLIICMHQVLDRQNMFTYDGQRYTNLKVDFVVGKLGKNNEVIPFGDNIFAKRMKVKRSNSFLNEKEIISNHVAEYICDREDRFKKGDILHFTFDYPLSSRMLKDYTIINIEDIDCVINNIDEYEESEGKEFKLA